MEQKQFFHENGRLKSEEFYDNNFLVEIRNYDNDGKLISEKTNKNESEEIIYLPEEKLIRIFKNNSLISETKEKENTEETTYFKNNNVFAKKYIKKGNFLNSFEKIIKLCNSENYDQIIIELNNFLTYKKHYIIKVIKFYDKEKTKIQYESEYSYIINHSCDIDYKYEFELVSIKSYYNNGSLKKIREYKKKLLNDYLYEEVIKCFDEKSNIIYDYYIEYKKQWGKENIIKENCSDFNFDHNLFEDDSLVYEEENKLCKEIYEIIHFCLNE